jgi:hypothetical protein
MDHFTLLPQRQFTTESTEIRNIEKLLQKSKKFTTERTENTERAKKNFLAA